MSRHAKKRRRHSGRRFFLGLLTLALIASALIYDGNTRLVTTEYTVESAALPAGFDGFRIVQLSDLHATEFGDGNARLISAVRDARPDLIAVTGDLTDGDGQIEYAESLVRALTLIAPVYYVTGNHEWGSGTARQVFTVMDENGAVTLRNRYVTLERGGDSIVLAGVDDPNGLRDQKTIVELTDEIKSAAPDSFVLMLAHRNNAEYYDGFGIDLVLCGHSHGGVIRLPFTDGLIDANRTWFPKNTSGLCRLSDGGAMLVSRGLGNTPHTFRFLNNPEIVAVTLVSE